MADDSAAAAPGAAQERTSRTSMARSATTALEFATAQIMTSIAGLSHDAAMAVIQNMQ